MIELVYVAGSQLVWELTLSCGHVTTRRTKVPPKSVICKECERNG